MAAAAAEGASALCGRYDLASNGHGSLDMSVNLFGEQILSAADALKQVWQGGADTVDLQCKNRDDDCD